MVMLVHFWWIQWLEWLQRKEVCFEVMSWLHRVQVQERWALVVWLCALVGFEGVGWLVVWCFVVVAI